MSRRRTHFATAAGRDVREAYAAQLRAQWQGRVPWSHFGRLVDRLERGEVVTVPAWSVRRWTGFRPAAVGGPEHVRLESDGRVVPVVAVRGVDDVITWEVW
jgi:hypothetical protein